MANSEHTYRVLDVETNGPQNNDIYPQVVHMGPDYRFDDPDSVTRIITNGPLRVVPNMHSFHLDDATKLTDLITQGFIYRKGLLASGQFVEALERYVVQAFETYPADVVFHGQIFNYTYLHFIEEAEDHIDYQASEFAFRTPAGPDKILEVPTRQALRAKTAELIELPNGELVARKIAFKSGTPKFDLLCISLKGAVYFVSDRLAEELVRRRLTGFDLRDSDAVLQFE